MDFFDAVDKWITCKNLIVFGALLLLAVVVYSFFLKTFWGQSRFGNQDTIYGKPGANIKKKKQLHEHER